MPLQKHFKPSYCPSLRIGKQIAIFWRCIITGDQGIIQMRRTIRIALFFFSILGGLSAQAKDAVGPRGAIQNLSSIGDALNSPDRHPVHILYVPGIGQVGAGNSVVLRDAICSRLKLCEKSDWKNAGAEFADKGEFADGVEPPVFQYLGNPVWNNPEEWHASAPFVVHWVVHLRRHSAVLVLDELNWWPPVMALKCRRILAPEAYLAGPDRQLLQVCSQTTAQGPDNPLRPYPWIEPEQAAKLEAMHPHAVPVNRVLKNFLVDWELSDVLLVTGPMGGILRDGMRQLMAKSAAFDPYQRAAGATGDARERYNWRTQIQSTSGQTPVDDQEFIGVSHSLGSYLLYNTLTVETASAATPELAAAEAKRIAAEDSAMQYIFARMSLSYFFANQLELLEITNLETTLANLAGAMKSRGLEAPPPPTNPAANFRSLVARWQQLQADFQAALHPHDESARQKVQVVAFNDPSDVITWRVPRIGNVDVVNLEVQNAKHWLWLVEAPDAAHDNYAVNKAVLRVLFEDTKREGAY